MKIKLHYKEDIKDDVVVEGFVNLITHKVDQIKRNEESAIKQGFFERTRSGVVGLTKSVVGIGIACDYDIDARREVCKSCIFRKKNNCTKCGCIIKHKTRIANESCPVGFWGEVMICNHNETKRSNGGCGCGKND